MSFEVFLRDLPLVHTWDGGKSWNTGGFDKTHLKALIEFLRPRVSDTPVFLETGAGLTTIALLFLNPSKLISIAPDADLFARIRASCRKFGVSDDPLQAYVEESQWALPRLAAVDKTADPYLDFALIDGCHGWPTAFVDLEYSNFMLKQGGYLMIDDVQLHSCKEMARLVAEHPAFSLDLDLGKAIVFRKTAADRHLGDWNEQPYVERRSQVYENDPNPYALEPAGLAAKLSRGVRRMPRRATSLFTKG